MELRLRSESSTVKFNRLVYLNRRAEVCARFRTRHTCRFCHSGSTPGAILNGLAHKAYGAQALASESIGRPIDLITLNKDVQTRCAHLTQKSMMSMGTGWHRYLLFDVLDLCVMSRFQSFFGGARSSPSHDHASHVLPQSVEHARPAAASGACQVRRHQAPGSGRERRLNGEAACPETRERNI